MHKWTRRLIGGGMLLVVAGAGLWLSGAGSAAGAGNAILSIEPASQNIGVGSDAFTLNVQVSNVENLGSFDITVTFNKDVLEYVGIARGPFLGSTGRVANCIAPGPVGSASANDNVNQNGALHFGCNTNGLVDNSGGVPGPNGGGVLMRIAFKPRSAGMSDIAFQGFVDGEPGYLIRARRDDIPGDDGERGNTGLGVVDNTITGEGSLSASIPFDMQGAVVQVTDPNAPQPTAIPATPTVVPAPPRSNARATVQAALGTPERSLSDITPAVPDAESSAAGGNGSGPGGGGNGDGTGSVAGSSTGSGGRTGSILPGSSSSASGSGSPGATGAPHAGFGPDPQPRNPWPGRASGALMLLGFGAIIAGAAARRTLGAH